MINKSYRNIIAMSMMVLILFSTIGFNIITTFCGGCDDEHVRVAFLPTDEAEEPCDCCGETDGEMSCCTIEDTETTHTKKHHHSQSFFAKLDINATEAKSKTKQLKQVEKTLHAIIVTSNLSTNTQLPQQYRTLNKTFAKTGRDILTRICVMLN